MNRQVDFGWVFSMAFAAIGLFERPAFGQISPAESAKTLRPADGFEVELWASEPMLANPTSIDVDSRGRVWVTEGLNYRFFANRQFQRQEGADRIKVLEDTDGDGKADKVTVFAKDIYPVPMGIAVEEHWHGGQYQGARVFVGNSPDLLVFEDRDGDDKADARDVFLSGFGGIDHDHGVHGFAFGPDGQIYFTQGDGGYARQPGQKARDNATFRVTDRSGRTLESHDLGTVLRVRRDGTQLERLAYRLRNDYEAAVDSFGNVFASDNDDDGNRGSRMVWILDGGNYGYRTPGSSRHWAEELPGIIPKLAGTGNGSPAGILVYEGDLFPTRYRGAVMQVDAGTRQINVHRLVRHGASFRTDYQVLLGGDDSWFRPIDAAVAPDGSLFVADWYDGGVGGHAFSDQTTGRIYRLRPKGAPPRAIKMDFSTATGKVAALRSPNVAARTAARLALLSGDQQVRDVLSQLYKTGRPHERARALYALADLGDTGQADVVAAFRDADARIRETAIRILCRDCGREALQEQGKTGNEPSRGSKHLATLQAAAKDPDPGVRREALLALRHVQSESADAIVVDLALAWDGTDRYYLEAARLALHDRGNTSVRQLFDRSASLIRPPLSGESGPLPPFFPTTSNDEFLHIEDKSPAATPESKLIGLAWAIERPEALPALRALIEAEPGMTVYRAIDRILARMHDPLAAEIVLSDFLKNSNLDRRRNVLETLGSRLNGSWRGARDSRLVERVFELGLASEELRADAIRSIGQAQALHFGDKLLAYASDRNAPVHVRAASIEALGKLGFVAARPLIGSIVEQAANARQADPIANAALTASADFQGDRAAELLRSVMSDSRYALDFRRRAMQLLAATATGADRLFASHRQKSVPDDLYTELTFLLHNHADARIRGQAQAELALPRTSSGRIRNLAEILSRTADVERGRQVFHRERSDACIRCHRVQGVGNWVGPDLSSIGLKFGRSELLYHVLNPSGAIGYNYVPMTLVLADGRTLTGLVTEESENRLVLKTALGERMAIPVDQIEARRADAVSLMPENLAQSLSEQDLADVVAYMETLRQPVAEVNEFLVFGPFAAGRFADRRPPGPGEHGNERADWRRVATGRDGYLDVSAWIGAGDGREVFTYVSLASDFEQAAQLVVVVDASVAGWLNTLPLPMDPAGSRPHVARSVPIKLRRGTNELTLRMSHAATSTGLVVSVVSEHSVRIGLQRP